MKLIKDYTLPDCLHGLAAHRSSEAYAIIGQGLWLLKAQALHSTPVEARGQGRKSSPTVALDSNEGFDRWLFDNVTGPETGFSLSRSSAFNYIRAAVAMGMTAEDDEDSITALREAKALEGKRMGDLYKPVPTLENGTNAKKPGIAPAPGDLWEHFQIELFDHFADESPTKRALYRMPIPQIEELETRLRTALDTVRTVKAEVAAATPKTRR